MISYIESCHAFTSHFVHYYIIFSARTKGERYSFARRKSFLQVYSKRAGIEGTISQGVRVMGLRRSRYIGQEKTHLQHVATAAALNLVRSLAWFNGVPRAQTRRSTFARLYDVA